MREKKAKLNLDFGHSGVSMNFAKSNDINPRKGVESDWDIGSRKFNTKEFETFPGDPKEKTDENHIKAIFDSTVKNIEEWQEENDCDFSNPMEVTVSANYYNVIFHPYNFSTGSREITESEKKEIEDIKLSKKKFGHSIPGRELKYFISPYYTTKSETGSEYRLSDPSDRKIKSLGFNTYVITENEKLSALLDMMKNGEDKIKISLSCEKEFKAYVNPEEKEKQIALIHISDSLSEFSIFDKSVIKYLNKKETGLSELKEMIWRLCLFYYKNSELMAEEFKLIQNKDFMRKFFKMVKESEISDESKDILSADDCTDLFKFASCILECESEESFKSNRFKFPGKVETKITIGGYFLNSFVREAMRSILQDIKMTIYNDNFCKPQGVILECNLPLKGIENIASEVFEVPARRAVVKWNKTPREDLSSAAVGALQSLISEEYEDEKKATNEKKTSSFLSIPIIGKLFSSAS